MKNKDLVELLEHFHSDDEVCVEIYDTDTAELIDTTYDIGFLQNEFKQLVLRVTLSSK